MQPTLAYQLREILADKLLSLNKFEILSLLSQIKDKKRFILLPSLLFLSTKLVQFDYNFTSGNYEKGQEFDIETNCAYPTSLKDTLLISKFNGISLLRLKTGKTQLLTKIDFFNSITPSLTDRNKYLVSTSNQQLLELKIRKGKVIQKILPFTQVYGILEIYQPAKNIYISKSFDLSISINQDDGKEEVFKRVSFDIIKHPNNSYSFLMWSENSNPSVIFSVFRDGSTKRIQLSRVNNQDWISQKAKFLDLGTIAVSYSNRLKKVRTIIYSFDDEGILTISQEIENINHITVLNDSHFLAYGPEPRIWRRCGNDYIKFFTFLAGYNKVIVLSVSDSTKLEAEKILYPLIPIPRVLIDSVLDFF